MSGVTVAVDNTEEVLSALDAKIIVALELCGHTGKKYARDICPVDTSRLKNSITHKVDAGEKAVYIGTNVEYGVYVEMGTSRMNAQPYLRPAASGHASQYQQIFRQVLSS